ncbi:hypothetical protein [Actinokineospora sp. NBRC 105648]|uniref:hypothetical protein n=1 Tax=Actinokineospora sp. NBRC 105648 TaxID=3032206 RepID=UPI0024A19F4E|nr:hypothetical protein [Actinokineospora sp. NBRC 105648]GLZ38821.1 hypothetical protein Acsp05_24450 [Actinokineospora sp. NBRC 105648]
MTTPFKMDAWVTIRDNVDLTYSTHPHDEQIDFRYGYDGRAFEFTFDEKSLVNFIATANTALTEARAARAAETRTT